MAPAGEAAPGLTTKAAPGGDGARVGVQAPWRGRRRRARALARHHIPSPGERSELEASGWVREQERALRESEPDTSALGRKAETKPWMSEGSLLGEVGDDASSGEATAPSYRRGVRDVWLGAKS